jgi:hypothetical protein
MPFPGRRVSGVLEMYRQGRQTDAIKAEILVPYQPGFSVDKKRYPFFMFSRV